MIDQTQGLTLDDTAESLYHACASDINSCDLIIFRQAVDQNGLGAISELSGSRLTQRFPHIPQLLLGSENFSLQLSDNYNTNAQQSQIFSSEVEIEAFLQSLRQMELKAIALESDAILPPHEGYLYKLPSCAISPLFIRVGNVQTNRKNIDTFFFWMIPYLRDTRSILSDTWSISSIALNVARLLPRYKADFSLRCRVDMLSHYIGHTESELDAISALLRRLATGPDGQILVLISAQMTGQFESRVRDIVERYRHDSNQYSFLTLYKLSPALQGEFLCDLSAGYGGYDFSPIDQSSSVEFGRTVLIEIDPETYFPSRFEEVLIEVRRDIADGNRQFFDRYANIGTIKVHRDVKEEGKTIKHKAIYIDVVPMMQNDQFITDLRLKIESLQPAPKLIISPPHEAGGLLREFAKQIISENYSFTPTAVAHPSLSLPSESNSLREIIESLNNSEAILIIDDTCQTGDRLRAYQHHLRDLKYSGRVHYLVAVARMRSSIEWKKFKQMLGYNPQAQGNTVDCVEEIVLPAWLGKGDELCPWCFELQYLVDRISQLEAAEVPEFIFERIDKLESSKESGLMDELFLKRQNDIPMTLGAGSLFLNEPANEADVFAAIAGAIQRLRVLPEGKALTPHRHPIAPVLNSLEYLREVFTSSVLRASFMRAAKAHELIHLINEREIERQQNAKQIITHRDPSWSNLTLEVFYNSAIGKLPSLDINQREMDTLKSRSYFDLAQFFFGPINVNSSLSVKSRNPIFERVCKKLRNTLMKLCKS